MADQVNPLGGLVPGVPKTPATVSAPPRPIPTKTPSKDPSTPGGQDSVRAEGRDGSREGHEGLDAAVQRVADFIQQAPSDLKFMVDQETGQYFFKILDPVTHETIRQVPSEEVLAMARRLHQLGDSKGATGVLVDAEG